MIGAWLLRMRCALTGHQTKEKWLPFENLCFMALCDVCEKCGSIVQITYDGKTVKL